MERLRFVFSLLLILSLTSTTLGSAIKAKNSDGEELEEMLLDANSGSYPEMAPNHKEIEALLSDSGSDHYPEMVPNRQELEEHLKQSNQSNSEMESGEEVKLKEQKGLRGQGNEMSKRADPGTVIAGAALVFSVLTEVLKALGGAHRKISIGIDNESGYSWDRPHTYFYSGTSDTNVPHAVANGNAVLWGARKTYWVARGSVGVLTYYVRAIRRTLAVMWSVPFDYNWYDNWWNAKLYSGYKEASYWIWRDMYYYADPFKGNNQWRYRDLDRLCKFRGSMTGSSEAILEIHVSRK